MLKLNGLITIKRLDQNGQLINELVIENIVTRFTFSLAITSGQSPFTNSKRIALSTSDKTSTIDGLTNLEPNFNIQNMNNIIAVGYWSGDNSVSYPNVNGYQFFSTPNRCRYHFRFPFTGSIRSFSTIALVDNNSGNNSLLGVTYQCLAYTTLDQAFVQQPNEIVDIVYDFTVNWATSGQEAFKSLWERYLFGQGNMPQFDHAVPVSSFKPSGFSQANSAVIRPVASRITPTLTTNSTLLKRNYSGLLNQNLLKGLFYSGLYFGGQNHVYSASVDINNKLGPVQNCFSHSSTSNTLYYDATNLATSSYKPIITGTDTTGFPAILSILAIDGGYRFIKKTFLGQVENTALGASQPVYFPSYSYHDTLAEPVNYFAHTKYNATNYLLQYQNKPVLLFYNVKTKTINKTVTLLSGATNFHVNDIAVSANQRYVYVASPTHGLFEIDTQNGDTVTRLSVSDTYFVCITPDNNWVISHPLDGLGFVRFAPGDWANKIRTLSTVSEVTDYIVMGRFRNDLTGIIHTYKGQVLNAKNPFIPSTTATLGSMVSSSAGTNVAKIYYINLSSNSSLVFAPTFSYSTTSSTVPSGVINQSWLSQTDQGGTAQLDWNGGFWPANLWGSLSNTLISSSQLFHNYIGCQGKIYLEPNSQFIFFNVPYSIPGTPFDILFCHKPTVNTTDGFPVFVTDTSYHFNFFSLDTNPSEYSTDKPNGTGTFFSGGPRTICKFDESTIFSNTTVPVNSTVRRGHTITKILGNDVTSTNNIASSIQDGGTPSNLAQSHYKSNSIGTLPTTWNEFDTNNRLLVGVSHDGSLYLAAHFSIFDAVGKTPAHLNEFYGWTGTQWQKGFNGSKPLHTESEALVDGLSLAWTDLSNNNSVGLVDGQWYTQVIGDGFLVDGYHPTNLAPTFAYYFRDKNTFNVNQVISNTYLRIDYSDPNFYRLDDHDLNVHDLYIDGALAQLQLTSPPGPGAITLNPALGSLELNSVDLGKTLTGNLVYTRVLHPSEINNPCIFGTLKDSTTTNLIPNLRVSIPQLGLTQQSITGEFFIPLSSGNTTLTLVVHDENGVYQEQTQSITVGSYSTEVNLLLSLKPAQTFSSSVKSIIHFDTAVYPSLASTPNIRDSIRGPNTFALDQYVSVLNSTGANTFAGKTCLSKINGSQNLTLIQDGAFAPPINGDNWTLEFEFGTNPLPFNTSIDLLSLSNTFRLSIRAISDTEFRLELGGNNSFDVPVNSGFKLSFGKWNKFAIVRSNGALYIFVNGYLYYSYTPTNTSHHTFALPLTLRGWNIGSWDFRISNNSLNYREIRVTYSALYTSNYSPTNERFLDAAPNTLVQLSGNVGQPGIIIELGNGPSGGINTTSDSNGDYIIRNINPSSSYQITVYDPNFNFKSQFVAQSITTNTVFNTTLVANVVEIDTQWNNVICHLPLTKGQFNTDYFWETKANRVSRPLYSNVSYLYEDYLTRAGRANKHGLFYPSPLQLTGVTGMTSNGSVTIEFWLYLENSGFAVPEGIFGLGSDSSFILLNNGRILFNQFNYLSTGLRMNTWTHVAITYSSSEQLARVFYNGIQAGPGLSRSFSYNASSLIHLFGNNPSGNQGERLLQGISDVRFTSGLRYTTNFTPPPRSSAGFLPYQQLGTLTLTLNQSQTTIKVLNVNNQIIHEQVCNTGAVINLPVGTYSVVAQKSEFSSVVESSVTILDSQNTSLTFTLTSQAQTKIDSEITKTTYYFNGITGTTINSSTSYNSGRNLYFDYGNKNLVLNKSFLSVADSANVNTSSGDFTLEFIFSYSKFEGYSGNPGLSNIWNEKGLSIQLASDTIIFPAIGIYNAPKWLEPNRSYHVAITRIGDTFRCFIDGIQLWTTTFSGSIPRSGTVLSINGDNNTIATGSIAIREFKITKTLGRYSSTFQKLDYLPIQNQAGYTVSGLVKSDQNDGLPGIKVWIPNVGQTVTDSSGLFSIPNVVPGNYSLIVNSKENGLRSKNRLILITVANTNLTVPDTTITQLSSNDNFSGYVSLLHNFNGTNNQIIFPEEKFGYNLIRVGNPKLSTTRYRSGTSSLYLDGSSSVNFPIDLALSNGDWTVEMWVWKEANTVSGFQSLLEYGLYTNGFWLLANDSASFINNTLFFCPTIDAGKWVHVAMVRYGTQFMIFHDGIRVLKGTIPISLTVPGNSARLTLGNSNTSGTDWFKGYIDSFRFTTGIARYINLVETPTL